MLTIKATSVPFTIGKPQRFPKPLRFGSNYFISAKNPHRYTIFVVNVWVTKNACLTYIDTPLEKFIRLSIQLISILNCHWFVKRYGRGCKPRPAKTHDKPNH